jgi:hypothetical protein
MEKKVTKEENINMNVLQKEFSILYDESAVIEIYREHMTCDAIRGRILQWSNHVLILEQLDDKFRHDGITAIRPIDITRIHAYNRELRALTRLFTQEPKIHFKEIALLDISAAMTIFYQKFSIVTAYTEVIDSGLAFVGEPGEMDDDFLVFRAWGTARTGDDYRILLRLPEITRVEADTLYIKKLHDIREIQRYEKLNFSTKPIEQKTQDFVSTENKNVISEQKKTRAVVKKKLNDKKMI